MTQLARRDRASLTRYDPDKGLKQVAVFEAVEKHYARAKDATKLQQAIRAKLEAQAEFVLWWDTKGPGAVGPGQPKKNRNGSDAILSRAGKDGLPSTMVVSRWRKKLNDPDDFETTFEKALARYVQILEQDKTAHVSQNSGDNEWYTPAEYVEAARTVLGVIDLDPASTDAANKVIQAAQIFTAEENGLEQRWDGTVWMNPPYATPLIGQFSEKLAASVRAGTVTDAIVLVNNATETQWFRTLVDVAAAICFPSGRVRFWQPDNTAAAPLQGQALLYVGAAIDRFCAAFAPFGFLAVVRR